jgi:hypothetical protein
MRQPYLLFTVVAAVVTALVVGCIGMLHSGRPDFSSGESVASGSLSSSWISSASVSVIMVGAMSEPPPGAAFTRHVFTRSAEDCYEVDPPVKGDPPGHVRMRKVDRDNCPFILLAPREGHDQR